MNTTELQCCISCDPRLSSNVMGVFAADQLPTRLFKLPTGFIANTDIHSKEGTHWCAFYIDTNKRVEFFDSYGKSPAYNSSYFSNWIKTNAIGMKYNCMQIQSDYSNVCGLYSLFYLSHKFTGMTLKDMQSFFNVSNFTLNDFYVFNYMSHIYSDCVKNECVYNQSCKPLIKSI